MREGQSGGKREPTNEVNVGVLKMDYEGERKGEEQRGQTARGDKEERKD